MGELQENRLLAAVSLRGSVGKGESVSRRDSIALRWWVAFAASTLLVVTSHLLMKAGLLSLAGSSPAASLQARILGYLFQPALMEGLALYVLASVCWVLAVAQKDVSFLYPLTSINYVLVVAGSVFVFHEAISLRRWLGVAAIVLGVMFLNQTRSRSQ
jgi:uncharacterized membrane protein